MRFCLMLEPQEGLTYDQMLAYAKAAEANGFDAMFRSDHFVSVRGAHELGSTDAWTVIGGLARETTRLRLGTLVSPVTFRHPSLLAKCVASADTMSGGRIEVGVGAGWWDLEHAAYGFPFPDPPTRFDMLEEELQILHGLWGEDDSFSFAGKHFRLEEVHCVPKPVQRPHPPILIGGDGPRRTPALAARYADEYNSVFTGPAAAVANFARIRTACDAVGRDPDSLRYSVMTPCLVGADEAELRARAARTGRPPDGLDGWLARLRDVGVVGTPEEAAARLRDYAAAGVERIMLQMQLPDDPEMLELLARDIFPHVD